jgi:hypothetical protein
MENTIRRVIEIEHDAQSVVAEGQKERERIREAALAECKLMEANIMEMAENKIAKLESGNIREAEDRIIRICEDTALKMRMMEEVAEENQKQWEDEIFNSIVRR